MIKRIGNPKNPITAKNFVAPSAELRRENLQKARQSFQQNSFAVDSPEIVYFAQVRNGHTCTCHASELPETIEQPIKTTYVAPELKKHTDRVGTTQVSFSTISKTPLFGTLPTGDEDDMETSLLDDSESNNPLFPNLFHKGTDCGICFRTGITPLISTVGRLFYSLTTHNYCKLQMYRIESTKTPNPFLCNNPIEDSALITPQVVSANHVAFNISVPKYYSGTSYRIFNNTIALDAKLYVDGAPLTKELLFSFRGKDIQVQVSGATFTHVFMEFDFGLSLKANFPQFNITKDYTYFFNLQQITIELPPSVSNAQVNDFVYVKAWDRLFQVFDVQPKYESPLQTILLGTAVQGRLVQVVETARILTQLKTL